VRVSQCNQVSLQIPKLLNLSYSSRHGSEQKVAQANDAVVETIVFPDYFSIYVTAVTGRPTLFHVFQWLLARGTKARCFAIKGATYQPW
jgi:hypothetical protein